MANENQGGISSASDALPVVSAPAPPQVIVQMMTPQAGEPTEGLSEIKRGGSYIVDDKPVDAHGQPLKGK